MATGASSACSLCLCTSELSSSVCQLSSMARLVSTSSSSQESWWKESCRGTLGSPNSVYEWSLFWSCSRRSSSCDEIKREKKDPLN